MKSMTKISQVLLFVACGYFADHRLEFMTNLRHKHFYCFRAFLCVQSETHRNASYQSGRSKTIKTHQNEIDDQNIAGAFVCSMRILRGYQCFRAFLCVQSETHRNAGSSVDANRSMYQCGQGPNRERQQERQKRIRPLVKQQLCTRITLFLYIFMLSHAAPLRRAVTALFHVLWRA